MVVSDGDFSDTFDQLFISPRLVMMLSLHLLPCFSSSLWRGGFERLKKVFVTPIIVRLTFELSFRETSYIQMHVSFTLLISFFSFSFFFAFAVGFCHSLINPLHPFITL